MWYAKKPKQYAYCFGLLITSKFYNFLAPYLVGIRNIMYFCTFKVKKLWQLKNIIDLLFVRYTENHHFIHSIGKCDLPNIFFNNINDKNENSVAFTQKYLGFSPRKTGSFWWKDPVFYLYIPGYFIHSAINFLIFPLRFLFFAFRQFLKIALQVICEFLLERFRQKTQRCD